MSGVREKLERLQRAADRICVLILSSDLPETDILIERSRLRALCEELFPGKEELFDMIYESRFDRLWEQFRNDRPGTEGWEDDPCGALPGEG